MTSRHPLGKLLLETHVLSHAQLETALDEQRRWGGRIGSTVVRLGYATERQVLDCLSGQLHTPAVDLTRTAAAPHRSTFPLDLMARLRVFPMGVSRGRLLLAMVDPSDLEAIREVEFRLGVAVQPAVATEASIAYAVAAVKHARSQGAVPAPRPRPERTSAALHGAA